MKLKILFAIRLFPPDHNCGGEYFVYNLSQYLLQQGHEVRVLIREMYALNKGKKIDYEYNGIKVFHFDNGHAESLAMWATHILSHLELTKWSIQVASIFKKPVFYISHNFHPYPCIIESVIPVNVIYNSQIMADQMQYPQRSIVLHPPLDQSKVDPEIYPWGNEWITLINCNERKGGSIFREIIKRMPEKKFLLVMGGYDEQIVPQKPNIMVMRNTDDILKAYRLTRIILMPSSYESYGMVATEAAANGIPVICTPTPGLKENLADAGICVDSPNIRQWMKNHEEPAMDYLDESDIELWIKEIQALDDPNNYFSVSKKCKERASELDPLTELQAVEKFIQDANANY